MSQLKTLSMRLRGAKTELEELGEDTEGMASSTAKMRKDILGIAGVDIMKNEEEFKNTFQVMSEIKFVSVQ